MKQREERRDRTIRVGERRRKRHLKRVHPDGVVDCACDRSPWMFAKKKGLGCDCRARKHGAPKTGRGMCAGWCYRVVVQERISAKRVCHRLMALARAGSESSDGRRDLIERAYA